MPSPRRLIVSAVLGLVVALGVTAACSPLATFNALTPKDGGSRQAADGVAYGPDDRQKLDIYVPVEGAGAHPVVVFAYGGSWNNGSRSRYAFVGRALAAEGFVTAVIDYRLVPDVVYPAFVEDGALAVRWVADHIGEYGGDPARIVLAGHSAGAYNMAMLGVEPAFLKAAGVDRARIRGVVGLSGPYDFYPFDMDASRDAFGAAPVPEKTQPVNLVRRGLPPFFIATGDDDELVRPRNSRALTAALEGVDVPVTAKIYPGLDHADTILAFSVPFRDDAPVFADVVSFARRVTR